MSVSKNQTPPSPGTSDALLIEIWKQISDDLRHRETLYMQIIVCVFLFLGAFGAIVYHVAQFKGWMWIIGSISLIAACVYVHILGKGQESGHEAVLQIQRDFAVSDEVKEQLDTLMKGRRPRFSRPRVRILFSVLGILLWAYIGATAVLGLDVFSILKAIL